MMKLELPKPTKRRLVEIYQLLQNSTEQKITSDSLSLQTGYKASSIRHDFWLLGFSGGVSNGYNIQDLKQKIKIELNLDTENSNKKKCCIVGLGRLGAALLDEDFFRESPFQITAGFDSSVNRVEILRSTFPLYPSFEMESIIKREKIEYAILTVKNKEVHTMTERLINAGIKGIINMTNLSLSLPAEIKVENLSIINALNNLL